MQIYRRPLLVDGDAPPRCRTRIWNNGRPDRIFRFAHRQFHRFAGRAAHRIPRLHRQLRRGRAGARARIAALTAACRRPPPPLGLAHGCKTKPDKLIRGATGDWEVVIGMEVHAQVTSKAKLFSGASTEFGGAPNSHVSLVDAAMPGMLPVINAECVRQAVRTRARAEGRDQSEIGVRPQELFLSRPAAGLSDQPVQAADRRRGRGHGRSRGRRQRHRRHRAAASRAGRGKKPARPPSDACPMSISTAPAWR